MTDYDREKIEQCLKLNGITDVIKIQKVIDHFVNKNQNDPLSVFIQEHNRGSYSF